MTTKRKLNARLLDRKRELDKLEMAYVNFVIGDKEYEEKRPILIGRIKELEDLLCLTDKK